MEPENHLIEKDNHLPTSLFLGSKVQNVDFHGCIYIIYKYVNGLLPGTTFSASIVLGVGSSF